MGGCGGGEAKGCPETFLGCVTASWGQQDCPHLIWVWGDPVCDQLGHGDTSSVQPSPGQGGSLTSRPGSAGSAGQYGLYSSFMGCFVYCLLGTAKDVTLGPTAIMSLLVSSYAFHQPAYAVLLAFLSGCIQLAMGLMRLGFLLDFISCPVIKGFTSAASITISFNQVKNILGLQGIPRQFFLQLYETLRRIGETRSAPPALAGDAVLGLSCLAALAGLRAMKSHLPQAVPTAPLAVRISHLVVWICATARNALVVLFAGLVAYSFQVMGCQPFRLTGRIPQGLPPFRPPPFSLAVPNGTVPFPSMLQDMGVGLAVVPLMGLLESVAIAKAFAVPLSWLHRHSSVPQPLSFVSPGVANVLGSFVSSYPITGSFGRTAVNAQSGVSLPCALVLLSLAYLTSLFYYIPKAALAAVIISAVVPMFDAGIFRRLWRVQSEGRGRAPVGARAVPQCSRAGATLARGHFPAPPQGSHPELSLQLHHSCPSPCTEWIPPDPGSASPARPVLLDCSHVSSIDYTAVLGLAELLQELHRHGLPLAFCALQEPVLQVLLSADLEGFQHFPSREEAGEALAALPGWGECGSGDTRGDLTCPAAQWGLQGAGGVSWNPCQELGLPSLGDWW
uniref:STAS domain-containing protein n=1 Tax=Zonotrichia albicollis TaxID=44394 RepID=A0A8D2MJL1_ZONAL